MIRTPIELSRLLSIVDDPRATEDLRKYFQPTRAPGTMPRYSGSRFEFLAGGGDRPETADRITVDDLVAVTLLSVDVPGDVALQLLEGDLGRDISRHLQRIPTDVAISDRTAAQHFASHSHARVAWDLLEEPHGMGWVITGKLLARKRPQLLPVYDRVVRCAFGRPDGLWNWLLAMFADDGARLTDRLEAARDAAGVSPEVSALRVLDVIFWMRHRPVHLTNGCAGLV
ncbi:hypothetical protein E9549_14995 [Blastococcus sp. MG754426]|uniref:DUF6308 family protein n=1 Tax=unclassified Blastococcus TaxID=2619396 RepID=UPI001EF08DDA|nr:MULTISPECIES: DUF6308 family protein [unclassified Blastococcus]MCF6508701.1 hypothetical protein [Blastococcus sp. MG754426]MCF6513310.1 hypothetical protein [Blastococcus sp. MG754427]MCF6734075.1 hypothetical protein [Blastococcus sp. KM273129]